MTVMPFPTAATGHDLERILGRIDSMAAQRPAAAQVVSVASSDGTGARTAAWYAAHAR